MSNTAAGRNPSAGRSQLSIAMIVRNAADFLDETLESVRGIADEIVIVDTGSTDETTRIAYAHATKLIRRSWDDDFSTARNMALAAATGDWVLWLDAGETITPEDAQGLRRFIDGEADRQTAYALLIQVPQHGANIAGEQIARIRLIPNLPGITYAGRIRESAEESLDRLGVTLAGLPYRIHRGVREHDPQRRLQRARRNVTLADLSIQENGPSAGMLNCIGDALQVLGNTEQATAIFQQSLMIAPAGSTEMLEAYYGLLTTLDTDAANRPAQLALCLKSLETFPLDAQLLCAMGGYLQMQGRMDLAIRAYETAYRYGQVNPRTWHLDEIREIAACCYAIALQLQNQLADAVQILQAAIAENADSVRLHKHLIDLYIKQGMKNEAIAQARNLPARMANAEAYRNAVRGACMAYDRNWPSARAYLEMAYHDGCREPLCLRWLTVTLLAMGEHPSVRAIVEEWRTIEPTNQEMQSYLKLLTPDQAEPNEASNSSRQLRLDAGSTEIPSTSQINAPMPSAINGSSQTRAAS